MWNGPLVKWESRLTGVGLQTKQDVLLVCGHTFKVVVLNRGWRGQFCPVEKIWHYLEMLVVTTGGWGDT